MKCCVPSCEMTADNYGPIVLDNLEEVSFHEIPTKPWLRKSWLVAIGVKGCSLPQGAVVCSQHFQKYDFSRSTSGFMKLRKNSVPSVLRVPGSDSSSLDFCLICLDTGASKLFPLNKNHLARAYTNIIGLDMSDVCDLIAYPQLCPECAHRLTKCDAFKNKALRAHSVLIQLLLKDKVIKFQGLKSVNRKENRLTSSIIKDIFKPDHYDLYVTHDEDDNNIPKKENKICNSHKKSKLKSEKFNKTKKECKKSGIGNETVHLSEAGDINNDFEVANNVINIDHKIHNRNIVSQVIIYEDKINDDVNIIDPDKSNNDKIANDKGDVFIICDSDEEVEFVDNNDTVHGIDDDKKCQDIDEVSKHDDMKCQDIDEVTKRNISDDIGHDIDDECIMTDNIDDDVRSDVIDDIDHGSKRNMSDAIDQDVDEDVRRDNMIDDTDDDIGRDTIEGTNHDIDHGSKLNMSDAIDQDVDEDVRRDNMIDDTDDDIGRDTIEGTNHDIDHGSKLNMSDAIDQDVDEDVRRDNMIDDTDDDIGRDTIEGTNHDIDHGSKRDMSDAFDHDIDEDVRRDMTDDIDIDIDEDVRRDMTDDIDHDIDDDIGRDMIDDIDHDIDDDIGRDMTDDIDHDIDDDIGRDMTDDIDHNIDDDIGRDMTDDIDHNIDDGIEHDIDSGNIDIDVDPDIDELLNKNPSSDRLLNKLKNGDHSENKNKNLGVNNGTKCKTKTAKAKNYKTIKEVNSNVSKEVIECNIGTNNQNEDKTRINNMILSNNDPSGVFIETVDVKKVIKHKNESIPIKAGKSSNKRTLVSPRKISKRRIKRHTDVT